MNRKTICFHGCAAALLAAGLIRAALAQPTAPPPPAVISENLKAAQQAYQENLAKYKNNADVLVLPGLVADRKQKVVTIMAQATALKETDPVEFFLTASSGKGYEALAIAFAKPSDVHQALEFIGMAAGKPVDFAALQYWPKGERVIMTFEWDRPSAPAPAPGPGGGGAAAQTQPAGVRAESLIVNANTHQELPATGLVFCGSYWGRSSTEPDKKVYAADLSDSKSIASDYNDPTTVLDLPRQSAQSSVYATQKPNPAYRFAPRQMIRVVLRPERPDGSRRVRDLELAIAAPEKAGPLGPPGASDLRFALLDVTDRKVLARKLNADGDSLAHMLAALGPIVEAHQDPFVSVSFGPRIPIAAVRHACALLRATDSDSGMRIEPPPAGQLYYRAFLPDERLRDPANRTGQPWELHLTYQGDKVVGVLRELHENWEAPKPPKIEPIDTPAPDAKTLAQALERLDGKKPRGIIIFAPADMPYGQLLEFLTPSLASHNQLWVFLPEGK